MSQNMPPARDVVVDHAVDGRGDAPLGGAVQPAAERAVERNDVDLRLARRPVVNALCGRSCPAPPPRRSTSADEAGLPRTRWGHTPRVAFPLQLFQVSRVSGPVVS
jgi:hypothetical protein